MPLGVHLQRARLQPGHLEEVLHQAVQPVGFLVQGLEQVAAGTRVETPLVLEQGAGGAGDRGERRAEIVRDRAQQRVAQALGLGADLRPLRVLGEPGPLNGQRGLAREGLELVELLRRLQRTRILGPEPEHPHGAARAGQRQVERGGARERIGALAGDLPVLMDPLTDRQLARVHRELGGVALVRAQSPVRLREQHHDLGPEHLRDVPDRHLQQLAEATRAGQLAAHRVQRGHAPLALPGRLGLGADAHREAADHEGHHQHDREGDEVLGVRDREGEVGRHEEEIEGGHAQHRRHQGRAPTVPGGRDDHAEQVDHDQVGEREVRKHRPGDRGRDRNRGERVTVRCPVRLLPPRPGGQGPRVAPVAADHVDVDLAAALDERVHDRAHGDALPEGPLRLAHHDLAHVAGPRKGEDLVAHPRPGQGVRLRPELLGQPHGLGDSIARVLGEAGLGGRLHVGDDPLRPEPFRHALGRPYQANGGRARPDADQQPLAHRPRLVDRVVAHVVAHLRVHVLRGHPQGQLAQRDQVALAEEVLAGLARLVRDVDLAVPEAVEQVVGGQVDQLHLVGVLEDGVRHRLAHDDAGDLGHHVVQALDVLHVHRGVDVDARVEQLEHVLPALGVARAGRVGVGQLVDQHQGGPARQRRVEIELLERGTAVLDRPARQDLQVSEERFGLRAPVGLDPADDHVDALGPLLARGLEHRVGLADAGGGPEENLELAACLAGFRLLDAGEQLVGVRATLGAHQSARRQTTTEEAPDSTTAPPPNRVDTGGSSR